MWPIIMPYYQVPDNQNADQKLTQAEWEALYDEDEIRAIARYVNRQTEKPPTVAEFKNLFGTYKIRSPGVYLTPGGNPITGAVQASIVIFPDNPCCEHLILAHGCWGINTKEAERFHHLEHTDRLRLPFHPVRHEHKEG